MNSFFESKFAQFLSNRKPLYRQYMKLSMAYSGYLIHCLVLGEDELFAAGEIGKTPTGGSISTYKDLCSLATDLNKPDLVYKFISLANHNSMWNSRKVTSQIFLFTCWFHLQLGSNNCFPGCRFWLLLLGRAGFCGVRAASSEVVAQIIQIQVWPQCASERVNESHLVGPLFKFKRHGWCSNWNWLLNFWFDPPLLDRNQN